MISVDAALTHLFDLIHAPTDVETVPLTQATGRVLARPVCATRNQPPFATSVMDGYAVRDDGPIWHVVGEAAAGHGYDGQIAKGQALRIFTGAPVPTGATRVVIQEDVTRDGDTITLNENADTAPYIRPAGADFETGDELSAPRVITPRDIALIAAMNHAQVTVHKRPSVAIISTGDELVTPGETPADDQIIASNAYALAALLQTHGADPRILPIARDTTASLQYAFELAQGADLVVTIGGASVGDHDLVGQVAGDLGLDLAFYKIAMRPGKPLMAGRMGDQVMVGLPGNPVSSMVCGLVFLVPLIRAMQGLPPAPMPHETATLAIDLPANGMRAHYMRAVVQGGKITPAPRQDSGLLSVLQGANALLIRAANAPQQQAGEQVQFIKL